MTNAGPELATNVVLTTTMSGVPFEPGRLAKGCAAAGDQIVCSLGNLASGKTAQVVFNLHPADRFRFAMTMRRVKS